MKDKMSILIPEDKLMARIAELGRQITEDYKGEPVHLVGILKGSVFFMCALSERIELPVTLDFMQVSSYGDQTTSSGVVRIHKDTDESLEGKNVLIVEDIIDSGRTMSYLLKILEARRPKSMKLATLLDKPSRRVCEVRADYTGFEVEDKFVIGFGLDFAQKYRNLPFIGVIDEIGDE